MKRTSRPHPTTTGHTASPDVTTTDRTPRPHLTAPDHIWLHTIPHRQFTRMLHYPHTHQPHREGLATMRHTTPTGSAILDLPTRKIGHIGNSGHYLQHEIAAKTAKIIGQHPDISRQFPPFQVTIMRKSAESATVATLATGGADILVCPRTAATSATAGIHAHPACAPAIHGRELPK